MTDNNKLRNTILDMEASLSTNLSGYSMWHYGADIHGITRETLKNAIEVLKAQEPRVMTLEEMWEGEVYWFDCPGNFILRPVICNMYDRGDSSYLNFIWQHGNFSWKICEYGRTWRCWTSRPATEQIDNTPWEERDDREKAEY